MGNTGGRGIADMRGKEKIFVEDHKGNKFKSGNAEFAGKYICFS